MSLSIIPTSLAIKTNMTYPFGTTGGIPPYTFSIVPGGAGGIINASTGLYTSPNATGGDTIQVIDSLSATAQSTVLVGTPLELFCDVLQKVLGLSNGRVYLWDQKILEPKDQAMYIPIEIVSSKVFSNSRKITGDQTIQGINVHNILSVNIKSRGIEALNRKEEVVLALNSNYSEQQQELNSFRIFPLTNNIINLSDIDGAAIPYRFNLSVAIQYFVQKVTDVPYYDSFRPSFVLVNQ